MSSKLKYLEWFGVLTAIAYSLFVASNMGLEFIGFILLFVSAISIGMWTYFGGHRAFCSCNSSMLPQASSECGAGTAASWSGISPLWMLRTS